MPPIRSQPKFRNASNSNIYDRPNQRTQLNDLVRDIREKEEFVQTTNSPFGFEDALDNISSMTEELKKEMKKGELAALDDHTILLKIREGSVRNIKREAVKFSDIPIEFWSRVRIIRCFGVPEMQQDYVVMEGDELYEFIHSNRQYVLQPSEISFALLLYLNPDGDLILLSVDIRRNPGYIMARFIVTEGDPEYDYHRVITTYGFRRPFPITQRLVNGVVVPIYDDKMVQLQRDQQQQGYRRKVPMIGSGPFLTEQEGNALEYGRKSIAKKKISTKQSSNKGMILFAEKGKPVVYKKSVLVAASKLGFDITKHKIGSIIGKGTKRYLVEQNKKTKARAFRLLIRQ